VVKTIMRFAGVLFTVGIAALLFSSPASAHVTAALDGTAAPGDYAMITLRVPTESGTVATTKVEMRIPDDVVLKTVLVEPVPGWRIDTTKKKIPPIIEDDGDQVTEVVESVTWTATGPGVPLGQFVQFGLDVGPLPEISTLALPTVQIFSDGTKRGFTEKTTEENPDPESPEPTVSIGAAQGGGMGSLIAWTALGLSVIALALGVFAIDRARASRPATEAGTAETDSSDAAAAE
jgi:periplasmic copper chaperone A